MHAHFAACLGVLFRIQLDSQLDSSRDRRPARISAPFSPMPPVKTIASAPPKIDQQSAQVAADLAGVNVQRQLGVARSPAAAAASRSRMSPLTPLIPNSPPWLASRASTSVKRLAGALHDQRHGKGIEIADAIVLRQARLRTHAHRRPHAVAIANRTQTARTAQVTGDQPQIVPIRATRPCGRRCNDDSLRESRSAEYETSSDHARGIA